MTTLEKLAEKVAYLETRLRNLQTLLDRWQDRGAETELPNRDLKARRVACRTSFEGAERDQGELALGRYTAFNLSERGNSVAVAEALNLYPENTWGGTFNPSRWIFRLPDEVLSGQPNTTPNGLLYVAETATPYWNSSTQDGIRFGWWATGRIQSSWDGQPVSSFSSLTPLLFYTCNGNFSQTRAEIRATSWIFVSDERTKTEIAPIRSAADRIKALRGIQFKQAGSDCQELGFSAQDVKDCIPEAVVERDDGLLGLNTNAILAVLASAVSELIERVERIENEAINRTSDLPPAPDKH